MWLKSHLHKTVAVHENVDRKSSLFHFFTESVQFPDADHWRAGAPLCHACGLLRLPAPTGCKALYERLTIEMQCLKVYLKSFSGMRQAMGRCFWEKSLLMRAARNNLWSPESNFDFFIPPEVGILLSFPNSLWNSSPDLWQRSGQRFAVFQK